jgi:hypothetical protein
VTRYGKITSGGRGRTCTGGKLPEATNPTEVPPPDTNPTTAAGNRIHTICRSE